MNAAAAADDEDELPHPRQTRAFISHAEAEQTMLDAYRSGRMPHAWLIGGPSGIGKATLAYRMARFVLAHPDPATKEVKAAKSLAVAVWKYSHTSPLTACSVTYTSLRSFADASGV